MAQPIQQLQKLYHRLLPEEKRLGFYRSAPRPIRRVIDRLGHLNAPPALQYLKPTARDIDYCYRLLLKRDPTPAEKAHWLDQVERFQFDLYRLVHDFMVQEEYVSALEKLNAPTPVDIGDFTIFVRLNDHSTGRLIATHKVFEPHVVDQIQAILQPGETFIDIGANIGFHSLVAAARVGPEGRVLAFEPHPLNCELLEKSIAANRYTHLALHPMAVGDAAGELELLTTGAYSNGRLVPGGTPHEAANHYEKVPVVRLDDFLAGIDRIDLIKMDIEGAEALAWRGMRGLLEKHRPVVLTEFFPDFLRLTSQIDPEAYLQLMMDSGYDLYPIDFTGQKTARPFTIGEIVHHHQAEGGTHIDLMAVPAED